MLKARDIDSTVSADEGGGIYEMPDGETCFDDETCFEDETRFDDNVDVSSTFQQAQATLTSLIPFGPHRKLSRGDDMYAIKEKYQMVQDKNLFSHLVCF
jgi:hypothetical protein